jgi:predicted transposase/invertase (TIGR01784 family)
MIQKAHYANPLTDFAFKRLFGTVANKDILIDFLNCMVKPEHKIADLNFGNIEALPTSSFERKAFFDIRCTTEDNHEIIVEMQKAPFPYMKDRALFYSSFAIKNQAEKGVEWDFNLNPVYFIAILDYEMDKTEEANQQTLIKAQLRDDLGNEFSDKLFFRFLQLPSFKKTEPELFDHFDKWCYFLKHAKTLQNLPEFLNEQVFDKSAKSLEVSNFDKKELDEYEESIKGQRDLYALLTANEEKARVEGKEEGYTEGKAEGKAEGELETKVKIAREMKIDGFTAEQIKKLTGLDEDEYESSLV